jgi:5,10-methylenetetrahydrofolate reductase
MERLRHWSVRHARGLKRVYDTCARYAPHFDGALRWVGKRRAERVILPVERAAKSLFFDCQMCGQCVLSWTGMACPTNCAKQMRNGPCGGVRADGSCEVDPSMRCVWVEASEGRERSADARPVPAYELAPIDHRRHGRSSWVEIVGGKGAKPFVDAEPAASRPREIHDFERACRSGRFVVTVEVAPPDTADPRVLVERAMHFSGLVDAINITDGAGANCHMSSVAASAVLVANGLTPVWQIACRDRNRIAIQGELLGAAALGIRNVLCLTGDDVSQGDHPAAKPVFDLDSVSLLRVARTMRDRGTFASGRTLDVPPNLFLGATANPFVPPYRDRVRNLQTKIDAGAQFIQTQFCFDRQALADFMQEVRARELHKRCAIIVGVGTLNSAKGLRRMVEHVPGVHIPDAVIRRVEAAADQRAEGKKILIETIEQVAAIEGVAGVHLMGHRNERVLAEVIAEAGLRSGQMGAAAQSRTN